MSTFVRLMICGALSVIIGLGLVQSIWAVANRRRALFVYRARPDALILTGLWGTGSAGVGNQKGLSIVGSCGVGAGANISDTFGCSFGANSFLAGGSGGIGVGCGCSVGPSSAW